MMLKNPAWLVFVIAPALWSVPASAQNARVEERRASVKQSTEDGEEAVPTEGFWPTKVMLNHFFDRMVDDMAQRYELDADQVDRTRDIVKSRIPEFMQQNRARIQRLMNEFIEVQLSGEAPSVEHVTEWAQSALPLINKFKGVIDSSTSEIRDFMTDDQQLKLDAEKAAFDTGLGIAITKVTGWSEGGFDPEHEWPKDETERRAKEREERIATNEAMAAARKEVLEGEGRVQFDGGDQTAPDVAANPPEPGGKGESAPRIAVKPKKNEPAAAKPSPSDEWTRYVDDFIARYELNVDQQGLARRCLDKRKELRTAYLKKPNTLDQIDTIEKRLKAAGNQEARADAEKQLAQLNAPIDRYFQQLKDDLEKIPTRQQRAKAARSASDSNPSGEKPRRDVKDAKVSRRGADRESSEETKEGPSSP